VLTLVLALVLILHALFALVLWYEMQPKLPQLAAAPIDSESEQALVVRLIDHSSEPRVVPPPEPPSPPTLVPPRQVATPRVRPVTHEKPRSDAMVVQDHEAAPAPAASSLFAKDGSVRLAPAAPTNYATTNAKAKPATPADDRQIMQHDYNQMHTKTTRFEKYFPPPNETAGGKVGRHVGDAIKAIAASICDPKKPGFNPLCGAPPIPPSPKDGDERLNLPSRSLADDPNPPKPPPLSTCFAEYRETRPLSYGCPINTPDLAFKADVRECIDLFRAGRYLKPYCPADTPKRAAAESATPAASSSVGSH
jgi:hypothetical protein